MNISFFTSVIFDIAMLAIVVLAVLIGKSKGLFRTLYSILIIFIAVFLANLFSPYVAKGLEKLEIRDRIQRRLDVSIEAAVMENGNSIGFDETLEKLDLPETVKNFLKESGDSFAENKGSELAKKLSAEITDFSMKIIGYVAVAAVVIIALVVISLALKIIKKLPLLGSIDAVGGGIAGFLAGLVIVFVICLCVYAYTISHTSGIAAQISSQSFVMKLADKLGVVMGVIR